MRRLTDDNSQEHKARGSFVVMEQHLMQPYMQGLIAFCVLNPLGWIYDLWVGIVTTMVKSAMVGVGQPCPVS